MCPSVAKPWRSAPAAAPPAGQPAAPYERSCSWGVSHSRRTVPTPRASHHSPLARLWVVSLDRSGPLGIGLSAKYTSSRRVSLRSDWYADAYVSFSGEALSDRLRSTEFSIVANNLLDKGVSVGHHRERGVALGAADGLDDRDRLVLMAATAPVPKPLPTASTSPRRETRA